MLGSTALMHRYNSERKAHATLSNELVMKDRDVKEAASAVKTMEETTALLQQALERTQQEVASAKQLAMKAEAKRVKLAEDLGSLKKDLKSVQTAYHAALGEKDTAVAEQHRLKAENEESIEAASAEARRSEEAVEKAQAEVKRISQEAERKKEELDSYRGSVQSMKRRLGGFARHASWRQQLSSSPLASPATLPTDSPPPPSRQSSRTDSPRPGAPATPELPEMERRPSLMARPIIPRAVREMAVRRVGCLDSSQMAAALGADGMRMLVTETPQGNQILMEFAEELKEELEFEWDAALAVDLKLNVDLTDDQLDEMRKAFALVWSQEKGRYVQRVWWRNPFTGKEIAFPAPIVSRYKWKPEFSQLCKKHKIEAHENGKVAERSCTETLKLLLERNLHLADPAVGRSADRPLTPVTTWDAVSWQHRKVTHGGWKFANYKSGIATQSEWKVVTAGVGKCDDHWGGQSLLIPRFAKEFNAIKRAKTFHLDGVGLLHVDPGMCNDLAFTREAGGKRSGAATHCECDGPTEVRRKALHDPPDIRGDESVEEIDKILAKRCTPITWRRSFMYGHAVPWDHDWSKGGVRCDADSCKKIIFSKPEDEAAEIKRLLELRELAVTDKDAAKKLEKELKTHAESHKHHVKGRGCRFEVDALDNILDILHAESLNLAKTGFKYSWLDGILDDQREELAALSIEGGWACDFRKKAKDGGQREADKKWMKASQVNVFFDGKSGAKGPPRALRSGLLGSFTT